jgi:hypothetical protein
VLREPEHRRACGHEERHRDEQRVIGGADERHRAVPIAEPVE